MSLVKAVCRAMERIAPLRLAEKWDNVGLLLESPTPLRTGNTQRLAGRIFLTIDLTPPVLDEALALDTEVIIAYHPTLFKPVSALTLSNPLQASLLRCVQAGISVYSPHTALDSVHGGINDWLASGLGEGSAQVLTEKDDAGGAGRLVTLSEPTSIRQLVQRIKKHLGISQVALSDHYGVVRLDRLVKTIGICAGSGGLMLNGPGVDADVYFTGEMSHHEVLAAIAMGRDVILCGHTNTERGYLPILAAKLREQLDAEVEERVVVEVIISQKDRHPLFNV